MYIVTQYVLPYSKSLYVLKVIYFTSARWIAVAEYICGHSLVLYSVDDDLDISVGWSFLCFILYCEAPW